MREDLLAIFEAAVLKPNAPPTAWAPDQVVGADILTNGGFTGGITGWTLAANSGSDPTVTAVNPDGSAGTGAAKWFGSAASFVQLRQTAGSVGTYYFSEAECAAYTAGSVDILWGGNTPFVTESVNSLGVVRGISRCSTAEVRPQAGGAAVNLVLNYLSVKPLTVSTQRAAPSANMRITQLYTLPASPVKGDQLWLPVRISSWSSGNYLMALLIYTGTRWDVQFYTVTTHGRSGNLGGATNIGSTSGLRVNLNGNSITIETLSGSTWTARGTTMTNSNYNTATDFNVLATPDFTLGTLSREAAV